MKVLHVAAEIAGQPALLCRALRQLGVDARSISFYPTWAGNEADIQSDGAGWSGLFRRVRILLAEAGDVDILHVHFGTTFLPRMLDVAWLHRRGVRFVFHFHGCDVRPRAQTLAAHEVSACTDCPVYCSPRKQTRLRRIADEFGAAQIISTPDLFEAVPDATHIPVGIDVAAFDALRATAPERQGFVVLHAPSDPLIKGTAYVEAAVEAVAARRPDVELLLVQKLPAVEARRRFVDATVAVDQVHMGWHGLFGVEAMLLGKPLLVYIRPSLANYRTLPVVPTTRETLADDLTALYDDAPRRHELAEAGIEYARREHDMLHIARQIKSIYERQCLGDAA